MGDPDDDFELIRRWREGDADAGDRLLSRHFTSIFRFFRSKVPAHAEDLAQRTLLDCVEARDRIDDRASFRAYLFKIARRRLADHFRRHHRRDERADLGVSSVVDLGGSPSQVLAAQEDQARLLAAMQRIPLDFQIALELHYWEHLKVAEIAEVLGIATGTVKSRLSRARDKLQAEMAALERDPGVSPKLEDTLTAVGLALLAKDHDKA